MIEEERETPKIDPETHPDNVDLEPDLGGDPVEADDAGLDELLPLAKHVGAIVEDFDDAK